MFFRKITWHWKHENLKLKISYNDVTSEVLLRRPKLIADKFFTSFVNLESTNNLEGCPQQNWTLKIVPRFSSPFSSRRRGLGGWGEYKESGLECRTTQILAMFPFLSKVSIFWFWGRGTRKQKMRKLWNKNEKRCKILVVRGWAREWFRIDCLIFIIFWKTFLTKKDFKQSTYPKSFRSSNPLLSIPLSLRKESLRENLGFLSLWKNAKDWPYKEKTRWHFCFLKIVKRKAGFGIFGSCFRKFQCLAFILSSFFQKTKLACCFIQWLSGNLLHSWSWK